VSIDIIAIMKGFAIAFIAAVGLICAAALLFMIWP